MKIHLSRTGGYAECGTHVHYGAQPYRLLSGERFTATAPRDRCQRCEHSDAGRMALAAWSALAIATVRATTNTGPAGRSLGAGTACPASPAGTYSRLWTAYASVRARHARRAADSYADATRYATPASGRNPYINGIPCAEWMLLDHDASGTGETGARGYFPASPRNIMAAGTVWNIGGKVRGSFHTGPIPPMSGGSPYADRGTGWHADDCLCRRCTV